MSDTLGSSVERLCGEIRATVYLLNGAIAQLPHEERFVTLRAWFEQCERRLTAVADALAVEIIAPDRHAVSVFAEAGRRWVSPFLADDAALARLTEVPVSDLTFVPNEEWSRIANASSRVFDRAADVQEHVSIISLGSRHQPYLYDDIYDSVVQQRAEDFIRSFTQRGGE